MAQSSSKTGSDSQIRKLQFLRVLIPNPFVKLRIPPKILKHLKTEPHSFKRATIYSPHGKFWHIDLLQSDDDLYFDGGWTDFSKAHDLRTGYFILFRYMGDMVFNVKVFDNSMCLKDYARESLKRPNTEIFEGSDRAGPSNEDASSKRKKLEASNKSIQEEREKLQREEILTREKVLNQEKSREERERLLDKEILNTSPNSCVFPKFEKIVRAYNLGSKGMTIPRKFCKRHRLVSGRVIFLLNTEGRSWSIWFYPKYEEGFFGKGWTDFAKDSKLKLGQKCVFQLVKQNTFLVHVMELESEERETLTNNYNLVKIFKVEKNIRSYNSCYMILPLRFCVSNGLISDHKIFLWNSEGKSWPVKFYYKEYTEGRLRKGWETFMKDNKLKKGDRCIFRVLDENTLLVDVVYSGERTLAGDREESDEAGPSDPIKIPKEEILDTSDPILNRTENETLFEGPSIMVREEDNDGMSCPDSNLRPTEKNETVKNADDSNSFSEIEKIILPYNLKNSYMNFTREFVKQNNLLSSCGMILKVSDGKTWAVNYTPNRGKGCLGKGWTNFCTDKALRLGDKCIFKLVSKGTFLVQIEKKQCIEGLLIESQHEKTTEMTRSEKKLFFKVQNTPSVEKEPLMQVQKVVQQNMDGSSSSRSDKKPSLDGQNQIVKCTNDFNLTIEERANDSDLIQFPQIEITITSGTLRHAQMMLSKEFFKDGNLLSSRVITLKDSDGKSWAANLRVSREKGYMWGWKDFIKEKGLKLGDRCVCKLVGKDTLLVDVVEK